MANVTGANGTKLSSLKHKLTCQDYCTKIYADIKGVNSSLYVNYNENTPIIQMSGKNIGDIITALESSQNLTKGSFSAELKRNSKDEFSGDFMIKNIEFTENSILFTIMKLTSITGILDILSQKNVMFTEIKGDAQFRYKENTVLLENVYANSNSISISSKGKYNIATSEQSFQGVLTPNLYGINNLMSKLPIIGGDKGFIGINYKVFGDGQKKKISVNPLSILTPGFLRNIIQW